MIKKFDKIKHKNNLKCKIFLGTSSPQLVRVNHPPVLPTDDLLPQENFLTKIL